MRKLADSVSALVGLALVAALGAVPITLDAILLTNAYHHLDEYQSMLAHMRRALKPDGRMVIIDYTRLENSETPREQSRKEQTENHEIRSELVQADLQEARFDIADRHDSFIRLVTLEWMIVAQPSTHEK